MTFPAPRSTRDQAWLSIAFAVVLVAHVFFVTRNWESGWLFGHEFRQTQTAISAFFIKAEDNYSLAYPTPVLGKPWSAPMEFPLYQWSVAALSTRTGWSLTACARAISAICFYATLPAIFLLLGRLGLPPPRRLFVLALLLTTPIYIFYSRAFLIEAMALAFSAWFLAAFVEMEQRRSWRWLLVAILAGVGAALVKITTFMVWIIPGAVYGAVLCWQQWRSGEHRRLRATLAWGLGSVLPSIVAALWWIRVSDRIKGLNPAGANLQADKMVIYNFGPLSVRFDPSTWQKLFHNWHGAVLPLWAAGLCLVLAWFCPRTYRRPALWAAAVFFAAQLVFPVLYSIHDYYFYAAAAFLAVAAGLVLAGLLDSALPRPVIWFAALALFAGNAEHYWSNYYAWQKIPSVGGTGLSDALRNTSPPDSVLVIIGDDWDPATPYYAQRRALMIGRYLEHNWSYLEPALNSLRGEDVFALVAKGDQRGNREFIDRAIKLFQLDPQVTFTYGDTTDVYVRRWHRNRVLRHMGTNEAPYYDKVRMSGTPDAPEGAQQVDAIERFVHDNDRKTYFAAMSPAPVRYNFLFGLSRFEQDGHQLLGA
ncbi:MAG TPA: glycosyltransferase family 39 protein, partial [Candidatus Didemnitutus sp.]|nr:glycosyltransferase family 39 protein [Candidatus Didemnitutus sp.]